MTGAVLVTTVLFVSINLIADIIVGAFDPVHAVASNMMNALLWVMREPLGALGISLG